MLKPSAPLSPGEYASDVHLLFSTHIEVVGLTTDVGGPEPPSFHERLTAEAINGYKYFQDEIAPSKRGHMKHALDMQNAGALNDGFFHWQKNLFESAGDMKAAVQKDRPPPITPGPGENTTWPSLEAMPEYQKLRDLMEKLSRRYLIRSGASEEQANKVPLSIFNWAAVHPPGGFHGPHTHVGEYHVGVFYAQVGPDAGKLRFGDPRGQIPPFGSTYLHTPKAGQLVIFPSWLSHMATVTAPETAQELRGEGHEEPFRVIYAFNIGPVEGPLPCWTWFADPTGDMRTKRHEQVDPAEFGFLDEDFGVEGTPES